jgi:hypothetical protein
MEIPEWLLFAACAWALLVTCQLGWLITLVGKSLRVSERINDNLWDMVRHQPWHFDD